MTELLIVYNKFTIPRIAIERLCTSLFRSETINHKARAVYALAHGNNAADDFRLFDLGKLPKAEAKEILKIVKGAMLPR